MEIKINKAGLDGKVGDEMVKAVDKVIIALDYKSFDDVKKLTELLGNEIKYYKVGLELFLNEGARIIDYLHSIGKEIFLDLKFHDITNTVKMACEYAAGKNIFMFNIHAACGMNTMTEVAKMLEEKKSKSICIAVTVLTNMNENEIKEIYHTDYSLKETSENLTRFTKSSGLHGVVCSAQEAKMIKNQFGEKLITVCPGVRPE